MRRAGYTYVVGDDELDLGVFEISSQRPGRMRRALPGELPDDAEGRAKAKPDLEALTALPPFEGSPYGGLLGLGSGSNERRDRGFYWELDAHGALDGDSAVIELEPLYYAAARGARATSTSRAPRCSATASSSSTAATPTPAENAIAELDLEQVMSSMSGDRSIDVDELERVRGYDLGELDGTRLCFSDATPLSDDLVVFTASAEADDGEIRGSVVGTIDPDGRVRAAADDRPQVEGRGRARRDRRPGDRLRLRLRPGRPTISRRRC